MGDKINIKYLVLLTKTSGFYADDVESTYCIASFDTEEEADEFVEKYRLGPYDIMLFVGRGKSKY